MTDSDLDRPFTVRDALAVLEALRVYGQMRGHPHEHWTVAIAALQEPVGATDSTPVEVADYAEAELTKAIAAAEDALANVERLRREARELRAATTALREADQRRAV